jgi:diguanylate cyclase (GGDEF)-like protein
VLYFDFENLNEITKTFGNALSNEVVKIVCDVCSKQIRTSDIFGRLATNEFGVLLVRCDNANAWKKGEALAGKLHQALAEVQGHPIAPIINYGAYTFRENEDAAGGIKQAASVITRGNT